MSRIAYYIWALWLMLYPFDLAWCYSEDISGQFNILSLFGLNLNARPNCICHLVDVAALKYIGTNLFCPNVPDHIGLVRIKSFNETLYCNINNRNTCNHVCHIVVDSVHYGEVLCIFCHNNSSKKPILFFQDRFNFRSIKSDHFLKILPYYGVIVFDHSIKRNLLIKNVICNFEKIEVKSTALNNSNPTMCNKEITDLSNFADRVTVTILLIQRAINAHYDFIGSPYRNYCCTSGFRDTYKETENENNVITERLRFRLNDVDVSRDKGKTSFHFSGPRCLDRLPIDSL